MTHILSCSNFNNAHIAGMLLLPCQTIFMFAHGVCNLCKHWGVITFLHHYLLMQRNWDEVKFVRITCVPTNFFQNAYFKLLKRSGLLGQFHLFAWVKTQNIWAKSLVWAYVISHLGNLQQHENCSKPRYAKVWKIK